MTKKREKKSRKKGKEGPKEHHPRWAQKVIFHIRTVKRNRNEIEAQKNQMAGPIQHFKSALLDALRNKVAADVCGREGFRGGPLLDIHGSLQLLNSSHVRERDKALLRNDGWWCLEWFASWSGARSGCSLSVLWCS